MDSQLQSISKIFTEKLFRIPDYQRGYAWGEKQLKDFWNDILQLDVGRNHYVGVLTLEEVPQSKWKNWEDDSWIIESKNYAPFYVVDGQQRLTTTIILIQVIIESLKKNEKLNFTASQEIRKKFIHESKNEGISRSYLFGYEKDNPSYEFLKRKIFMENSGGYRDEDTIYTLNLINAKKYFEDRIAALSKREIEIIYKKVSQNLLFNIYTISSDIDVFVAFETMNNRGKPLSNLELLKNRLIYISTKFESPDSEKNQLRRRINDSWKAVYHFLGKNKERPLNDDPFLYNHFIIYFGKLLEKDINNKIAAKRRFRNYYEFYDKYLLEEKFTQKNIKSEDHSVKITIQDVNEYINSLQEAVKIWYNIFNPWENKDFEDDEKLLLDKIVRLSGREYFHMVLAFYLKKPAKKQRISFLENLERNAFFEIMPYTYYSTFNYTTAAINLSRPDGKVEKVIHDLGESIKSMIEHKDYLDSLSNGFINGGFYDWMGIKYFLYEYELSLQAKTRTKRVKINWNTYFKEKEEFVTVEHIYPQKAKDSSWAKVFDKYTVKQKKSLCNSLGNLLPLSIPKNSSLQNSSFLYKVDNNKNKVGYRYGSYSENEISKLHEWTPKEILDRGLKLLDFLEERWQIKLGDVEKKTEILGLKFLSK